MCASGTFCKRVSLGNERGAIVENGQVSHLGYRYHFQDQNNRFVFRYDDTPHFPNLPFFPYHKHTPIGVESAQKPSIIEVINEATYF
ncbi:MAG: toxin TumE [bacterium]